MATKPRPPQDKFAPLRHQARKKLARKSKEIEAMSPAEVLSLVHELQAHQIELEIQNEELHQVQLELKKTQDKHANLYDFAPVGYLALNEKGTILEANLTAATLLGNERNALIKKKLSSFIHKEDQSNYFLYIRHVFQYLTTQSCELRLIRQDGSQFHALLDAKTVTSVDGIATNCLLSFSDITKYKLLEEELENNELKFRTIADFTNDWEYWVAPDNSFHYVSPSCKRITGYTQVEFINDPQLVWKIIHPADQVRLDDHFNHVSKGGSYTTEHRIIHRNGDVRWLEHICQPVFSNDGVWLGRRASNRDITERKQAEMTLAQSQSLMKAIVDSTSDMIWSVDSHHFGLLTWNLAFEEYFKDQRGIAIEIGLRPEGLFPPRSEFIKFWDNIYRHALAEGPYTTEYGVFAGTRTLLLSLNLIEENGQTVGISVFGKDITERKQAEEALRESEQRFHQMFESHSAVMLLIEPDSGAIVDANPAAVAFYGYPREKLQSMFNYDINMMPPQELAAARQLAKNKQQDEWVLLHRLANGEIRTVEVRSSPVEVSGRPLLFSIIQDITKRKRAEQALKDINALLNALLEHAPTPIFINNVDGHINLVNKAWTEATGVSQDKATGASFDEIFPPGIAQVYRDQNQEVIETDKVIEAEDYWYIPGEQRFYHTTLFPIHDNTGKVSLVGGISFDYTQRQKIAGENELLLAKLDQQNRMRQTIIELSNSLHNINTFEEALPILTQKSIKATQAEAGVLALVEGSELHFAATAGKWEAFNDLRHSSRKDLLWDSLHAEQPSFISTKKALEVAEHPDLLLDDMMYGLEACALVPLKAGSSTIGLLLLGYPAMQKFTVERTYLLYALADIAGTTLQRMKIMETLEHLVADRSRELATLYHIVYVANEPLNLEKTMELALEQVLLSVGSKEGDILLWNEELHKIDIIIEKNRHPGLRDALKKISFENTWQGWVFYNAEPLLIPDLSTDKRTILPGRYSDDIYSYLGVPVRAHGQVIGVLSIIRAGQAFNMNEMVLLAAIADHVGLITENARLFQRVSQAVVLEERTRLARELHDSATQSLYSVTLYAEASRMFCEKEEWERVKDCLALVTQISQQALKEMRLLVFELRPPDLEQVGLAAALQQRLDIVEGHTGIQVKLHTNKLFSLGEKIEENLYWIALEALNNALKHASANQVNVNINIETDQAVLSVRDNGVGFDLQETTIAQNRRGMGLVTMQERAQALGGKLEIVSAKGLGTTVTVQVPIPNAATQAEIQS